MGIIKGHSGDSVENNLWEANLKASRLDRRLSCWSKPVVLELKWVIESLEGFVKIQTVGPQPHSFWMGRSWVWPEKCTFLTGSQVMLTLLIQGPHFENLCWRHYWLLIVKFWVSSLLKSSFSFMNIYFVKHTHSIPKHFWQDEYGPTDKLNLLLSS